MTTNGRYREIPDYIAFMRRIIRAGGDRLAQADAEDLGALIDLRQELDVAIATAVTGLRSSGATWQDIGDATGTSRQAAFQKWGGR
jgi:hypothetical protein